MHWVLLLAVCIATIVAFAPGLRAPFQFDDIESITENATIRSLASAWTPPRQIAVSGRPIVNLSLALNYRAAERGNQGDSAAMARSMVLGTRVVNLAIHVSCGLLVFGLVLLTARSQLYSMEVARSSPGLALFVAAAWMIHPIQTEVVHYAIQRTESLMALFFLAVMFASARAWDAGGRGGRMIWYAVGAISSLLGMGCKEVMVVAPLMVVLYDRAFRVPSWRDLFSRRNPRLPYYGALALTTVWAIVLAAGQPRSRSVGFDLGVSSFDYLSSQGWAIWHYLRLVVWPFGLSIDYGPARVMGNATLIGLAALAAGAIGTVLAWRRAASLGWLAFLATWFFVILGPSSSIIPIATEVAAERRMYLPLVAVLSGLGVAAVLLVSSRKAPARAATIAAIALLAGLGSLTMRRSAVFIDVEQLWREAMQNAPDNARAPDNLATVIIQKDSKRVAEATALLQESLARDSSFGFALYKLGVLALNRDEVEDARNYLSRALALNPRHPQSLAELAHVNLRQGDTARAIDLLVQSTAASPNDTVLVQLGELHAAAGRGDEALAAYRRALDVNPTRRDLATFVGAALVENGRAAEGVIVLERLVHSGRGEAVDVALLAIAYAGAGRPRDAAAAAATVAQSGTRNSEAMVLAGRALIEISDPRSAEVVLSRAVELASTPAEALTLLAVAKVSLGKRAEAIATLQRAVSADPGYAPARAALRRLR